MHKLFMISS